MHLLPDESRLSVPDDVAACLLGGGPVSPTVTSWVGALADALEHSPTLVRIGELRQAVEPSRRLAARILTQLGTQIAERYGFEGLRGEIGARQGSRVVDGAVGRVLLPHHDGLHCSYLTPSRLDEPTWRESDRQFSSDGYKTTPAHKLYQGIFIVDPGEALSVTTYYHWVAVLTHAYGHQHGAAPDIADLRRWLAHNIQAAIDRRAMHGSRYLTLAAALGSSRSSLHAMSSIIAENAVDDQLTSAFPELVALGSSCSCGTCRGQVQRIVCHGLRETTGLSWREFTEQFETWVPSERYDLVLGNNLAWLHGGYLGGLHRLIDPMCIVMDRPCGPAYERWLAETWTTMWETPSRPG